MGFTPFIALFLLMRIYMLICIANKGWTQIMVFRILFVLGACHDKVDIIFFLYKIVFLHTESFKIKNIWTTERMTQNIYVHLYITSNHFVLLRDGAYDIRVMQLHICYTFSNKHNLRKRIFKAISE